MIQYLLTHPEGLLLLLICSLTITTMVIIKLFASNKRDVNVGISILDALVNSTVDIEQLKTIGKLYKFIRKKRMNKLQLEQLLNIRREALSKLSPPIEQLKNDLETKDNGFKI